MAAAPGAVADLHAAATEPADDAALQQGGPFARGALPAIIPLRLSIIQESLLVDLVLLPRDVPHVRTWDQTDPLVLCYEFYGGVAIGQPTALASSPHESSRIARVVHDLQNRRGIVWLKSGLIKCFAAIAERMIHVNQNVAAHRAFRIDQGDFA